jgi:hypothetical protein
MTGVSAALAREFRFIFRDVVAVNIPDELQQWQFHTRNQRVFVLDKVVILREVIFLLTFQPIYSSER